MEENQHTQTDTTHTHTLNSLRLKKTGAYYFPSQQGHGGNILMANDYSRSGYEGSWKDGS